MLPIALAAENYSPNPNDDVAYSTTYNQETTYAEMLSDRAVAKVGQKGGQCVTFAREFAGMGRDLLKGRAKDNAINSTTPEIGAVMITNQSKYGHAQVVINIEDSMITVVDSNYNWNQRIGIHTINKNDRRIMGYLIP
jgi:surface antigen